MNVGELLPTHKTIFVLCFKGTSMMFTPDRVRFQMAGVVDGLASKTYPRGRGETRLGFASGSLRV